MTPSRDIMDLPAPAADHRFAYGTDESQFGDLRLPRTSGISPLAIIIHGGFWRAARSLAATNHLCEALREAGVATWNLEYRRIGQPGGAWPGTLDDVAAGAAFVTTIAARHRLDVKRMVVAGHSAGGHLALWLAKRRIAGLRGTISLGGVVDLRHAWELQLGGGAVNEFLGGSPDELPDRYRQASPIELVPLGVPSRLIHGALDDIVPIEISRRFEAAARNTGDDVQLIPLAGAGHFEVIDPRAQEWPVVRDTILALLA
jgi:acetyl esterase/lipase